MSTAIWPADVPSCQLLATTEQAGDGRLRMQPDIGPAIVRRRTSAVVDVRAGQVKVTETQWQALLTFGKTTLDGWALPFLYPDAGGDLVRFGDSLPDRKRVSGKQFLVDLSLEYLP